MLKYRLTLGPVLIAALAVFAWLDQWLEGRSAPSWMGIESFPPAMVAAPLVLFLSATGSREVARILRAKGIEVATLPAAVAALGGVLLMTFTTELMTGVDGLGLVAAGVAASLVFGLVYAIRKKTTEGAIAVGSAVLFVHVYMGLMLGFLVLLRREHDIWVVIWVLACVKFCDIGAFFTGTTIGKRKLIPWLSPGKTWEGLAGGMVTAGAVGGLGAWWMGSAGISVPGTVPAIAMGVLFGVLGQAGDLMASLLKRDAGVKDAGTALPGFGGVLDLIDSPILVAPIAFWLLHSLGS